MTHEFQIEPEAFRTLLAQQLQDRLDAACLPDALGWYVDRVDALAASAETRFFSSEEGVRVWLPLDVFLVSQAELLAMPNAAPPGSQLAAGRAILSLALDIDGTVLRLQPLELAPGTLPADMHPFVSQVQAPLLSALGSLLSFDFMPALTGLGLRRPARSRVTFASPGANLPLEQGLLAIRFETAEGGGPARIATSQQWGWFIDTGTIGALLDIWLPLPGWGKTLHWRGDVGRPQADLDLARPFALPGGFAGEAIARLALHLDFAVVAAPRSVLRTTVSWSVDIELHTGLGGLLESAVEGALKAFVLDQVVRDALDLQRFGGVPLGDHVFQVDRALPAFDLGRAELAVSSAHGWPDGMTLGGPARLPPPSGLGPVRVEPSPFGRLYGPPTFCKGPPDRRLPVLGEVSASASAWLDGAPHICSVATVSPSFPLDAYVSGIGGTVLWVTLPGLVALRIGEPVRLIVRTPRGTRLVELGVPPHAQLDAQGRVTNAVRDHIDDCDYLSPDTWRRLTTQIDVFGQGPVRVPGFDDGPVPGVPGGGTPWLRLWAGTQAASVQVITVRDLVPGELIRFNSAHHQVTVSADAQGMARLPVFLPLRSRRPDRLRGGELLRVNRQSLQGRVSTRSLTLVRDTALAGNDAAAPLAPEPAAMEVSVPGVVSVFAIPGFSDDLLALGMTADGSTLVLDRATPGVVRVAGDMSGPVGSLQVVGDRVSVPGLAGGFRIQAFTGGCRCRCLADRD